jgi:hypothetical protein
MLGQEHFLDARQLLPAERLQALEDHRAARLQQAETVRRLREQGTVGVPTAAARQVAQDAADTSAGPVAAVSAVRLPTLPKVPGLLDQLPPEPATFLPIRRVMLPDERRCLEFLLEQMQKFGNQHNAAEIWASPFLRRLTDVLPELPDWERRQLLTHLRDAGAVRIEKREGEPHPFSVILVNYQHPDVRELNRGEDK